MDCPHPRRGAVRPARPPYPMKISRLASPGRFLLACVLALPLSARAADGDWETLFDGQTLNGWKAAEHPNSFTVVDGTIRGLGLRSHLFYLGADGKAEFENFELEIDFKAMDGANSGVYYHATWQPEGWPRLSGTEVQINNDQPLFEKNYNENKKTGSLYGFRNLYKAMAKDGEWSTYNIRVTKPRVQVRINGRLMIDYVEPSNVPVLQAGQTRDILTKGTFALQCHDDKSQIFFRNIRVRRLPPGEDATIAKPVYTDEDRQRQVLARDNFPILDLQVHLDGGLTLAQVQAIRNRTGLFAGIVARGGAGQAIHDEATAEAFVAQFKDEPAFAGLQVEGRDWLKLIPPATRAKFDYILGDAVAWADRNAPGTPEPAFMDRLTDRIVETIATTPVDVFANVTYLPAALAPRADSLWTEERVQRIVAAAVQHGVALEINPRLKLPAEKFVKLAKDAGARFTVGSGNTGAADYGEWSYVLEVQKQAGLSWRNMYVPGHEPTRAQRELARQ